MKVRSTFTPNLFSMRKKHTLNINVSSPYFQNQFIKCFMIPYRYSVNKSILNNDRDLWNGLYLPIVWIMIEKSLATAGVTCRADYQSFNQIMHQPLSTPSCLTIREDVENDQVFRGHMPNQGEGEGSTPSPLRMICI